MLSTLRIVTPATYELIDVPTAMDHCRVDGNDDGRLMELYIGSAREWAEGWLGRALVRQTYAWTVSDVTAAPVPATRFAPTPSPGTLLVPSLAQPWPPRRPLEIPRAPVVEVTSVTLGGFGLETTTAAETDYELDLDSEPGRILVNTSFATAKADRLTVNFVAGYEAPADVPKPIRHAVLLLVAHLWENRGDASGEMPTAAQALMGHYRLWTFG